MQGEKEATALPQAGVDHKLLRSNLATMYFFLSDIGGIFHLWATIYLNILHAVDVCVIY